MTITGLDPFAGRCRISRDQFVNVMLERPAASGALSERDPGDYWRVSRDWNIDPLFLLAMFNHESNMGNAGTARQTHSWGNTRLPSFGCDPLMQDGVPVTVEGRSGRFPVYATWHDGCVSTVARLASTTWPNEAPYGERFAIRAVFDHPSGQVWAPAGDLNNPHGYLASMLAFMNEYTDQDQPMGMAAAEPLALTIHPAFTPINFSHGRGHHVPRAVCLHITDGETAAGAIGWFHNPQSMVSAHYVVDRDGTIWQVVAEADTAWTQGVLRSPNLANPIIAGWVRDGVNPNSECVSIEAVGTPAQGWTTKQVAVVDILERDIAQRWNIPVGLDTIIGHKDIDSINRARCPSLTPAQWERLRQASVDDLTDAEKLELVWRRNPAAYGEKLYAGELSRPYYTGMVLRCTNALLTPDGQNLTASQPGGILDDVEQRWEDDGVLVRY